MTKKYFFFDIDGTLTDIRTGTIVPSALQTLQQLQANGHFVAIATGRAHYKARRFMEEVSLHNMVCSGGGALVIDDRLIQNTPLPLQPAKRLTARTAASRMARNFFILQNTPIHVIDGSIIAPKLSTCFQK